MIKNIVFGSDKVRLQTKDPKSLLQEHIQKYIAETPLYIILDETGKDHEKTFTIAASIQ